MDELKMIVTLIQGKKQKKNKSFSFKFFQIY